MTAEAIGNGKYHFMHKDAETSAILLHCIVRTPYDLVHKHIILENSATCCISLLSSSNFFNCHQVFIVSLYFP